tara:strand:+ start:2237 stop:2896 length:660 start_codon:yes stop_codon:yes gene_type:complete
MDLQNTFQFLIDLKFNNNRPWFNANKDRYLAVKKDFDEFIETLIPLLKNQDQSIDVTSAKECVFRIYRDARFTKNKEPYKTSFGAHISKGGRKSSFAGYYIHLEPDNSFIGGGIYDPSPELLKNIRTQILENTDEYKAILAEKTLKADFSILEGEKLKMAPKGFPKDFKDIDLLKNKHFIVSKKIENETWFDLDLKVKITNSFKTQQSFNTFLNRAVKE